MEGVTRARSEGVGIRVLVDGYWGFAATARLEEAARFLLAVPPGDRPRGKWHEIRVEVGHPELTARTKPGYYAR